jgi:hypothetical protein
MSRAVLNRPARLFHRMPTTFARIDAHLLSILRARGFCVAPLSASSIVYQSLLDWLLRVEPCEQQLVAVHQ